MLAGLIAPRLRLVSATPRLRVSATPRLRVTYASTMHCHRSLASIVARHAITLTVRLGT